MPEKNTVENMQVKKISLTQKNYISSLVLKSKITWDNKVT